MDLQGFDDVVLSVQPKLDGTISVGTKGKFKNLDEFRIYLTRSGLPFSEIGQNEWNNYVTRKEQTTIEFYQLD